MPLRTLRRMLGRLAGRPGLRGRIDELLRISEAIRGKDIDFAHFVSFLEGLELPASPSSDSWSSSESDSGWSRSTSGSNSDFFTNELDFFFN